MKNLTLITLCLLLGACELLDGKKDSSNSPTPTAIEAITCETLEHIGSWDNMGQAGDVLTVNSDCTSSSSYCEHTHEFTLPNSEDLTLLTINTANLNGGCMQPGTYVCALDVDRADLYIDCGVAGQFHFRRNTL